MTNLPRDDPVDGFETVESVGRVGYSRGGSLVRAAAARVEPAPRRRRLHAEWYAADPHLAQYGGECGILGAKRGYLTSAIRGDEYRSLFFCEHVEGSEWPNVDHAWLADQFFEQHGEHYPRTHFRLSISYGFLLPVGFRHSLMVPQADAVHAVAESVGEPSTGAAGGSAPLEGADDGDLLCHSCGIQPGADELGGQECWECFSEHIEAARPLMLWAWEARRKDCNEASLRSFATDAFLTTLLLN